MEKFNLKDLTLSELEKLLDDMGEKKFRAKQIFKWLSLGIEGFDEMTDISKDLRKKLYDVSFISKMEIVFNQVEKAHSAYHHSNQKWTTLQL